MGSAEEPVRPLVIAGSARSGTTWLLDALANANSLRTVFEPLHPDIIPAAQRFAHRYLAPDAEDPELAAFLASALAGEMRGFWPNYRVRPDLLRSHGGPIMLAKRWWAAGLNVRRFHAARRRRPITKFIRANLMLAWLVRRFGARVVLVVRHPAAVVASMLKTIDFAWTDPQWILERHLSDEPLIAGPLRDVADELRRPLSRVELYTALWCIENRLPIEQGAASGIHVACYERLVLADADEWGAAVRALGLPHRPSAEALAEPSQQASADVRGAAFSARQAHRWRERLADDDRRAIDRLLERFGIDQYRTSEPLPLRRLAAG